MSITVTSVNDNPTVTATNATVTVDEGQTATNTGTYGDVDGDTVTLTASRGTVIKNNDGTWSWSFATTDGPAESGPVTITANDGHPGGTGTAQFQLTVKNVAPTITSVTTSAFVYPIGSTVVLNADFTDPGADAPWTCTVDWDNGSGAGPATVDQVNKKCTDSETFTQPGVYSVTVKVTDKDGDSDTETLHVRRLRPERRPRDRRRLDQLAGRRLRGRSRRWPAARTSASTRST